MKMFLVYSFAFLTLCLVGAFTISGAIIHFRDEEYFKSGFYTMLSFLQILTLAKLMF